MVPKVIHQFTEGVFSGDAVSDHVFQLRRWLREFGYESEIYAEKWQAELADEVLDVRNYQPTPTERFVIYHHAVGSEIAQRLMADYSLPIVLIYHNITPAEFYQDANPVLAKWLKIGRDQLREMRERTLLAITASTYNEKELRDLSYKETVILPIVLDAANYDLPINKKLAKGFQGEGPLLLYVGRLVPNKKQEDLIRLLYYFRRIVPDGRLVLVGSSGDSSYVSWLQQISRGLCLPEDAVIFSGHVSQQDLVTYYRCADVYISMSEHEGFGKPFIESMYLNLPILAYGSAAVPSTLANTGLLFYEKDFAEIAELLRIILENHDLRDRIISRQQDRVVQFLEPQVKERFLQLISRLETSEQAQ